MVPKRAPEEPGKLSFAIPSQRNTLPREVHMNLGPRQLNDGETRESPVDGDDQPKIYSIRNHTLEVLMHPSVLELHAVRVVHTPHGDEQQLHLKVRVGCGKKEVIADVLVDTGARVSLVRKGFISEEFLNNSQRPVRLKVANGEIMGGGTHEATIGLERWEHDCLNAPDLAKQIVLSGNCCAADISDWDNIMGYDVFVSNASEALPHRATLVREDKERLTWLSTDHTLGLSQWSRDQKERSRAGGNDREYQIQWGLRRSYHGIWLGATSVQSHGSTPWRRKRRDGCICFPGCPAAKEMYEALAKAGLCVVKALSIEGVGAHVLTWCSRRHQTYGEQDYCG